MEFRKWQPIIGSVLWALLALGIFGFVVFKFLEAAGAMGLIFVGLAVLGNIWVAKARP
jgi:hypothetical protein